MSTTYMNLFRLVDGKKVKVRFTLDDQMTILDEQVMTETTAEPESKVKNDLDARGIKYEKQDGKIVITHIPEIERKAIEALTNIQRCWFEGCEEIIKRYQHELETMPSDCPDCKKGALIRKYRQILIDEAGRKASDTRA